MTTRAENWLTSTNRQRQVWLAAQRLVRIDEELFVREVETWPDEIDADVETTEEGDDG